MMFVFSIKFITECLRLPRCATIILGQKGVVQKSYICMKRRVVFRLWFFLPNSVCASCQRNPLPYLNVLYQNKDYKFAYVIIFNW